MNALRPLVLALVLASVVSIGLMIATTTMATGAASPSSRSLSLGPLEFLQVVNERTPDGSSSTVSVRPQVGLGLIWALFAAYGITVSLLRVRRGKPEGSASPGSAAKDVPGDHQ